MTKCFTSSSALKGSVNLVTWIPYYCYQRRLLLKVWYAGLDTITFQQESSLQMAEKKKNIALNQKETVPYELLSISNRP